MADSARKKTDNLLRKMEKKVSDIYDRAGKEIDKKTKKFWADFERKDKVMQKRLESGKITQEAYDNWRRGQAFTGAHMKEMQKVVSEEMLNASKTAADYVNGQLPQVYALNYNALGDATSGIKGYSFELVDANTVRNLATSDKTLLPYKKVNGKKVERWATQKVNAEIMQGIVQGESIPKIAKRLQNVTDMDKASSIRNARTTVTSAENKGRQDSYIEAEASGIVLRKVWMSAHDSRTREAHLELNGQEREIDEPFENGLGRIMYPGDPNADPANVYNCRCTLVTNIIGFKGATSGKINYVDSQEEASSRIVDGKDISESWTRRPDKFDFEIEDVIDAQGFNGLPKVVSDEEFEKAVKEANNGKGFIAQRTYSAPDQETLNAYRQQLYHGDWYVDCSTGGAQYGQGMYCAADYNGVLSDGIRREMNHYQRLNDNRMGVPASFDDRMTYAKKMLKTEGLYSDDAVSFVEEYLKNGNVDFDKYPQLSIMQKMDINDVASHVPTKFAPAYTETMTLDPSAKIISYDDIFQMKVSYPEKIRDQYKIAYLQEHESILGECGIEFAKRNFGIDGYEYDWKRMNELYEKMSDEAKQIANAVSQIIAPDEEVFKYNNMDLGAFAALNGYDAINAVGHGESASYTVVLNRTKLIIKEPEK